MLSNELSFDNRIVEEYIPYTWTDVVGKSIYSQGSVSVTSVSDQSQWQVSITSVSDLFPWPVTSVSDQWPVTSDQCQWPVSVISASDQWQ